MKFKLL
jgi:hypothetical protein